MPTEREYIALYRTLVEKKFILGSPAGRLKERDYEYLSTTIEEKSRVRLSVSTLKRLWKADFVQVPHPSTLDALVSVLELKDWQEFKKEYAQGIGTPESRPARQKWQVAKGVFGISVLIAAVAFFFLQGFKKEGRKLVLPEKIHFTANKTVTTGVPNTVIFNYDVTGIEADSFFIQQSWNPRNKVRIDAQKNYLSSIYYIPGFHRAKLIVNDSIVRIARVHIKTQGWLPILQYDDLDNSPVYLNNNLSVTGGILQTPERAFREANVNLSRKFHLQYFNVRDFSGVDGDNFIIETRLKHDSIANVICPEAGLTIQTEEHIYYVPLTIKGCVGELDLKIGERYVSGRDHDLSSLGCDLYEWQDLKITNEGKSASVFLNNRLAHKIQYKKDFGKIVGLVLTFNGPGSVDYIRLSTTAGDIVYAEDFNQPAATPSP